jgi:glycosyltransferase involved in cell wall biosynthesis
VVSPHTGRALAEAGLGAAPVVAYDVDWQGELIADGKTGALVGHGDVTGMAAAVVRMLAQPDRAKALGAALREKVLEMLDPEALNAHERDEYSRLLGDIE